MSKERYRDLRVRRGRGAPRGATRRRHRLAHPAATRAAVRAGREDDWQARRHCAREELANLPTVAVFATVAREGDRADERQVEHYNLDMVISIGYRVKSPEGVRFRRWASDVLRKYVTAGAAINERRLEQIGEVVQILARSSNHLVAGVADVLAEYVPGLALLRDYDEGSVPSDPVYSQRRRFQATRSSAKSGEMVWPLSSKRFTRDSTAATSTRRSRRRRRTCSISW